MLRHYLSISARHLWRSKSYTLINLLGLSAGLCCFTFIAFWVVDEWSYDRFHPTTGRVYRIVGEVTTDNEAFAQAVTPPPMARALEEDFPEVEAAVRLDKKEAIVRQGNRQFKEEDILMTDPSFFKVFGYELLEGDPAQALAEPFSIVLTESMARKYFGDVSPVGESLTIFLYDEGGQGAAYKITGLIADPSENSHFAFNFLGAFSTFESQLSPSVSTEELWFWNGFYTYLLLAEGASSAELESKLPAFAERYLGKGMAEYSMYYDYRLQPLADIYLHSGLRYELGATGSIQYLYIFGAAGILILLLAGGNYTNLAIARALGRSKEVGIKKVMGAGRRMLLGQFLVESVGLSLLAFCLALALVNLLNPVFFQLSGKAVHFSGQPALWIGLLGVALLLGLVSGAYPAAFLSAFSPVKAMRQEVIKGSSGQGLRRGMVVFQFSIAICMSIGLLIVQKQLSFIQGKELGFDENAILALEVNGNQEVMEGFGAFREKLLRYRSVSEVARSNTLIVGGLSNGQVETLDAAGRRISSSMYRMSVSPEFINAYDMELVAGRNFSAQDTGLAFIVNEAAVRAFGWKGAEEALSKKIWRGKTEAPIIGVLRDFHFNSLQSPIDPVAIEPVGQHFSRISIELGGSKLEDAVSLIQEEWASHFPDALLQYTFLDERLEAQYQAEQRLKKFFSAFAVLALCIACIGILGLVSSAAEQRSREIGIRKILGASVTQLMALLSRELVLLVLLATAIASPLAWYAGNRWLSHFAYRAEISWGPFVLAGGGVLLLSLLVLSIRTTRAALANPADALRNE